MYNRILLKPGWFYDESKNEYQEAFDQIVSSLFDSTVSVTDCTFYFLFGFYTIIFYPNFQQRKNEIALIRSLIHKNPKYLSKCQKKFQEAFWNCSSAGARKAKSFNKKYKGTYLLNLQNSQLEDNFKITNPIVGCNRDDSKF